MLEGLLWEPTGVVLSCFLASNNWISRHKTALSNDAFVQLTDDLLYPFADVLFAIAPLEDTSDRSVAHVMRGRCTRQGSSSVAVRLGK